MILPRAVRRCLVAAALLIIPLTVFFRALFLGEAFVPADLLGYLAPWSHRNNSPPAAAWNVLRFDGITEFYPWRWEAAQQLRAGQIPLWNPHSFAAHGGTPLLADSQSAPLYPPNLLFAVFPPGAFCYAFGLSGALHLLIAVTGMYCLLRRAYRLHWIASVFGAITFGLCGPVVVWLSLPTFLAVTCWIPWLLLLIHAAVLGTNPRTGRFATVRVGAVAGTMLLAGHLQMAFYGLLAAGLYAACLFAARLRSSEKAAASPLRFLWGVVGATALTVALALPQVLPSLELSRVSHRAADAAAPTMETYRAYVANALPVRNWVTLLIPDFFGHPNPTDTLYWNTNNYGEWATYVGIAPLLLAVFALALPWRGPSKGHEGRGFFALLGAVAFLLAMGTPLNLPFFFLIPGYSQTGNPARSLILAALALTALAALGLDALLDDTLLTASKRRAALIAVAVTALIAAIGAGQAAPFAAQLLPPQVSFGMLMTAVLPQILGAAVFFLLSGVLLVGLTNAPVRYRLPGVVLLVLLSAGDLLVWGNGYNPTAPAAQVYPVTPGIAFLQVNGKDALIAPLNRGWSLGLLQKRAPQGAVLPPNALTVYGLHDMGGYDSLFPGTTKAQVRDAGNGEDPSPPENGNMVFIKRAETAVALGARFLVLSPDTAPPMPPTGLREDYRGDDLVIWENPHGKAFDESISRAYQPDSFRIGLFCGLTGVGVLASALFIGTWRQRFSPPTPSSSA